MQQKITILIVDDHPIVRRGLAEVLAREPDIEVCGGADNVADALKELETSHPDLAVVDMTLKDSHGIELIREISSRWLTESVVMFLSRSGAYAMLGMVALGALCVGVEHPILTAPAAA